MAGMKGWYLVYFLIDLGRSFTTYAKPSMCIAQHAVRKLMLKGKDQIAKTNHASGFLHANVKKHFAWLL